MKKIFKPYMIRPTIYRTIAKIVICLVPCLLWERFFNTQKLFTIWEYPFFVAGWVFLTFAWFCYLKLDKFSIHHLAERKERPKRKHHATKSIVDFADEKIISFEELEPEEQTFCNLLSDMIAGILFLLPSFVLLFF